MNSFQSTAKQEKMSLSECLELGRRCAEGDPEARETLILSHIYLVEQILSSFRNKGVDTEDLFQEGCYGLLKAVDLYDYKRGVLFSTYAVHWIKKQMRVSLRSQSTDRPIILKDDEFWLLMKISSTITRWMQEFGYKPTCEELAKELNLTFEHTSKLLNISESFIYLDDPTFVKDASGLSRSAENEFFDNCVFLDSVPLTEREKTIIYRHLGFTKSKTEESLKEIATDMALSYETIRKDYRSALEKIKLHLFS